MKIGIKNFRVFEKLTNFEIKPLTILVGPNNSGKSSFTKFLMLLKNGYEYLNFTNDEEHNLSSFDKVLNRDSGSEELVLNFSISDKNWISQPVEGSLTYFNGGTVKNGSILNGLISFEITPEFINDPTKSELPYYKMTIQTQELIDFIKSNIIGVIEDRNRIYNNDRNYSAII